MEKELLKAIENSGRKDKVLVWGACAKNDNIIYEFQKNGIKVCGYIDEKADKLKNYNGFKVFDRDIIKKDKFFVYIGLDVFYPDIIEHMRSCGYRYFENYLYPNHIKNEKIQNKILNEIYFLSKKMGWYSYLKELQYNAIRNEFDEKSGRFRDIDRFAKYVKRKYGEDIYEQLTYRRIYRYMDRYKSEIKNIRLYLPAKLGQKINKDSDNAVFTMWLQGYDDMPVVVRVCLESMKRLGRKIILLTEENLEDYIYLPDYVLEKYKSGKIGKTHFSDIVRTSALAMYGGLWIDSTVYIAREVPDYMTNDLFLFKIQSHCSEYRSYSNWWIAAPMGHELILDQLSYLLCYWKYEDVMMYYFFYYVFLTKIINSNSRYRNLMKEIPMSMVEQTKILLRNFDTEYDDKKWERMKQLSPVFKCSYKVNGLSSYNSFYSKLCNGELK